MRITGGCQCGAVRYALAEPPVPVGVCHCRMCQKASGGPFMVFARVPLAAMTWTRSKPATFASSSLASRGFCATCGTPLTYQSAASAISITVGSLDDPAAVRPPLQMGVEARLPWTNDVAALPEQTTDEALPTLADGGRFVDHQHPDHDI